MSTSGTSSPAVEVSDGSAKPSDSTAEAAGSAVVEPAVVAPGDQLTITPNAAVQVLCAGYAKVYRPVDDELVEAGQLGTAGHWRVHDDTAPATWLDCLPEPSAASVAYHMPDSIEPGDYVLCLTDQPAAAACGRFTVIGIAPSQDVPDPSPPATPPPSALIDPQQPPDVTVILGETTLQLTPTSYCFAGTCVDGSPLDPPPLLGGGAVVEVRFPLDGWSFSAIFRHADEPCARLQTIPLDEISPGVFTLGPAGRAGTYDVTLFGLGRGDVFVNFRWTTTSDGPMPTPEARLAVLADHDGVVDSYGVELAVSNLAATPTTASATITVTAANGRAHTFQPTPLSPLPEPCPTVEGTVTWNGLPEDGLTAAALGPPPFTYDVVITIDGIDYRSRAAWPDDQIIDNEPSVALSFEPPLPSLPG